MPEAAELRTPLTLEREVEQKDDFGETKRVWQTQYTLRAKVDEDLGSEEVVGNKKQSVIRGRVTTRYRKGVKTTDRLRGQGGRVYAIESVVPFDDQRRDWMIISTIRTDGEI